MKPSTRAVDARHVASGQTDHGDRVRALPETVGIPLRKAD